MLTAATHTNSKPKSQSKSSRRMRADAIKPFRCTNLIAVLENPQNIGNIGTVIRNANALGVEKIYIIDSAGTLPDDWQDMRGDRALSKTSVSAVKWTFVKRFAATADCLAHLAGSGYESMVTSPHTPRFSLCETTLGGRQNAYLHEGDYTQAPKLAIWFGNEVDGISAAAVEHSTLCVAVPMFGMVESLNLATCSGIVLYEVTKQRRAYQSEFARSKKRDKREAPLPTIMPRSG